jgi:hypothetical protein
MPSHPAAFPGIGQADFQRAASGKIMVRRNKKPSSVSLQFFPSGQIRN